MKTIPNSVFRAAGQARRLLLVGAATLGLASVIIFAPAKADAQTVIYDQPSQAGGLFPVTNQFYVGAAVGNGKITHVRAYPDSSHIGQYFQAGVPSCNGSGVATYCTNGNLSGLSNVILFTGGAIDLYFDEADATEIIDYTGISTSRYLNFDIRYGATESTAYTNNSNWYYDGTWTGGLGGLPKYTLLLDTDILPPPDTTTRVVDFEPAYGATTGTTTVTFGADVYVNVDDYETDMFLRIVYSSRAFDSLGSAPGLSQVTFDFPISGSGDSSYSTTTSLSQVGTYDVDYYIRYSTSWVEGFLEWTPFGQFFALDDKVVAATSSYFIAINQNNFDLISDVVGSTTSAFLGSIATTSEAILDSCKFFSGDFNVLDCLLVMFVPSVSQLSVFTNQIKDTFLSRVPFGYFTRTLEIMISEPAVALPDPSYTFADDFPIILFRSQEFTFHIWSYFFVEGSPLNDELLSTGDDPKNVWQIVEPIFTFMVYFSLFLALIPLIMGIDGFGTAPWSETESVTRTFSTSGRNKGQEVKKTHIIRRQRKL